MVFLSKYQDRQSTLPVDHEVVSNERKGTVHSLNDFNITVWEDGEVTAQRKYYASSDPSKTFPNMSVIDGVLNIPIEDLVSFILARITPTELAEGILADDEAREALVEAMAYRYRYPGFEDKDRRKFLNDIQEEIFAISLDKAVERLNNLEETKRAHTDYYRWRAIEIGQYKNLYESYIKALNILRDNDIISDHDYTQMSENIHWTPEKLENNIKEQRDPIMTQSVGKEWTDSRQFWRDRILELFKGEQDEAKS